jgi:hypothetical protein
LASPIKWGSLSTCRSALHRGVKAACAKRGLKVSSVLRELLEREFPDTSGQFRCRCDRSIHAGNQMRAFIKRFLMHYGIYRRYPLGRFSALRNAWRAAQP